MSYSATLAITVHCRPHFLSFHTVSGLYNIVLIYIACHLFQDEFASEIIAPCILRDAHNWICFLLLSSFLHQYQQTVAMAIVH